MNDYLGIIKIALAFFPFIALLISAPFILIQYHKYGSISFLKALIIYSFVFYFICAYFLIILPLPAISEVAKFNTPRCQLIPLKFIYDFITETSFRINIPSTYLKIFLDSCFYVPLYNLLLTLPFGIYLRYYFNTNLKKTIFYTFFLSLFFELTQLSGLYFIYPRGYRLFDVDDLLLNTLGGILGYFIAFFIIKILPKREEINTKAKIKGKMISGFKKMTSFFLDLFIFSIIEGLIGLFFSKWLQFSITSYILIFVYYVLIPYFLKGSTFGELFINLRVTDLKGNNNFFKLFFRKLLFIIIYFAIPVLLVYLNIFIYKNNTNIDKKVMLIISLSSCLVIFIFYMIVFIKYLFTKKTLLYEKLSRTKMISTIK